MGSCSMSKPELESRKPVPVCGHKQEQSQWRLVGELELLSPRAELAAEEVTSGLWPDGTTKSTLELSRHSGA